MVTYRTAYGYLLHRPMVTYHTAYGYLLHRPRVTYHTALALPSWVSTVTRRATLVTV